MPNVYPFRAIQYRRGAGDVSQLIAPPYDVLDAKSKAALLKGDHPNVVAIDLPHTPAKELGPPETYAAAAAQFRAWLTSGVLSTRATPAMFAYRQTFIFDGARHQRTGMACTVDALPFGPRTGGGILPHEETFSGPKEDRLALMKAARAQFSPIFGLHSDDRGQARVLLARVMGRGEPDLTATMTDGVKHEVWTVDDPALIGAYEEALRGEDIFIADGHHRYTTGLNYLRHLESQQHLRADHPARRSMMVLVGMSDPGLVIGPTHRVLGGMKNYSLDAFTQAARPFITLSPGPTEAHELEAAMAKAAAGAGGRNVLGVVDFASKRTLIATFNATDPLKERFPAKPEAWRRLDVALVQYVLVEQVCQPALNAGAPVQWAFPHSIAEVLEIGRGHETGAGGGKDFAQLALVVRSTPLDAVRAVSRANELMPQKSTFFYPKLATGLFMHALE